MATVTGGDGVRAYFASIKQKVGHNITLIVGFPRGGETYPDGTPVASVAAWNEYGTSKTPARPFFRTMVAKHEGEWPGQFAAILKDTDFNVGYAFEQMGQLISDELQESIREFAGAPLAKSTVKRKGFDKALVETGFLLQSVDWKIVRNGDGG